MNGPRRLGLVLAITLLLLGASAEALDLGTLGPTYDIGEPHLLEMITQRLHALQSAGDLARLEAQARQRAIDSVVHPVPVAGLRATEVPPSFYFDPSVTLDRNLLGAHGELLYAAGTRKNPLDVVALPRDLLFFDARDRRQVQQARRLMARPPGRIKPILVGGSYLDLMQAWHTPVYYDQQGRLTRRLGITQVPALVTQDGRRLRIDELEIAP